MEGILVSNLVKIGQRKAWSTETGS